jgi:concanavalin A-like lectin/glucanase superfamily protein
MKNTVFFTVVMICSVGTAWGQFENWTHQGIGDSTTGSASETDGVWTVIGSGTDIWNAADGFHFAYTTLEGDGYIEARLQAPGFDGGSEEWAKAGVMFRETTAAGSKHAFMAITRNTGDGGHFHAFQYRDDTDEATNANTQGGDENSFPVWVRVVRSGDTFEGFYSFDGNNWTSQASGTISMNQSVLIGLAVTSHNTGQTTTVKFDNLDYTGMPKDPPQVDAGPDQEVILPDTATLAGLVFDNGNPLPDNSGSPASDDPNKLRWEWSLLSGPAGGTVTWSGDPESGEAFTYEGSANPPNTVFSTGPTATFNTPGVYELKLNATDSTHPGYNDTNDTVVITVYPVGYVGKVAHYEFSEPSGTVAIDTGGVLDISGDDTPVKYYNHGTHRYQATDDVNYLPVFDPNRVEGPNFNNTPLLVGSSIDLGTAILFDGDTRRNFVDLGDDPNAFDIRDEITVACWVKLVQWNRGWQTILAKGDNSWRLSRNSHGASSTSNNSAIAMHLSGVSTSPTGIIPVDDGEWHHVAATYDGENIISYVDGRVDTIYPATGRIDLSDYPVYIAENSQARGRYFWGALDDVQIYNVSKTQEEIVELAQIQNTIPTADAGSDLRQIEETDGLSVQIVDAEAIDKPGNVNIQWSVVGPGSVSFDNDTLQNPTVTFTSGAYGVYVFTMEVEDGLNPVPSWTDTDTMIIIFQEKANYGVLGMWQLDDGAGITAADSSGNGFHGTLSGDPNWTNGKILGALDFINNGNVSESNQAVYLDTVPIGGDLTASFWMNMDTVRNQVPIDKLPLTGTAGWNVKLRDNGEIWLRIGSESNHTDVMASGAQYDTGEWVYVTVTFDSATSTGAVYVNGLQVAETSGITQTADHIATPLRLGTPSETQIAEQMQGILDHVRIQDRALSQLEVALMAVEDMLEMEDCILTIPGAQISGDVSGPNGIPDCYVDVHDIQVLLLNWLICHDLNNPACWQ